MSPVVPRRSDSYVPTAPRRVLQPGNAFQPPEPINFGPTVKQVADIFARKKDEVDQLEVIESDAKLAAATDSILYDPEKGALNRRGKDALQGQVDAEETWRKRVTEIENGLKNDRQRLAFRRTAVSRAEDLNRALLRHVSTEMDAYRKETTQASLANEYGLVVKNYDDPARVQEGLGRMRAVITLDARHSGEPPELTQQRIAAAATKVHAGVISRFLATGQDLAASAYYAKTKDAITGDVAITLEERLEVASTEGAAFRAADEVWRSLGPKSLNDPVRS